APDRLRQVPLVLRFVADMATRIDRICLGLCHGSWILVSAGIMKGRKACAYVGMVDDMRNAGAELVDAPVAIDGNVITCSYYGYCGLALRTVVEAVAARRGNRHDPQHAAAVPSRGSPEPGGGTMPVIALDFDGVICDSTNECILSSWNAWNV